MTPPVNHLVPMIGLSYLCSSSWARGCAPAGSHAANDQYLRDREQQRGDNTADIVKPPAVAVTNHSAMPHST
jgi:hypothetical protein